MHTKRIFDRVAIAFIAIIVVTGFGTLGYIWIEGWSVLEALYMTVITLSTVGFGEIHHLSPTGRLFTVFLITIGFGVAGYFAGTFASFIVEGELKMVLRGQQMDRLIAKLNHHIIVCGYGRTGGEAVEELLRVRVDFVVIEQDAEKMEHLPESIPRIIGNATEDKVLVHAGIERAKGLITTLHNDADNVFVTLTARGLNPDLKIVSRAAEESSEPKLIRAGADKVILPASIGGRRMASVLLRPDVVDFLDVIMHGEDIALRIEQVTIPADSTMIGKSIIECRIREQTGAMIIGIRPHGERVQISPPVMRPLKPLDTLIVLGQEDTIDRLKQLVAVNGIPIIF
ncbi:MAG: potassium channel protein [Gemmatimonadetes bacterium]|nr:MAG: potassium channel protein [Gemmatimonadota bacterium]